MIGRQNDIYGNSVNIKGDTNSHWSPTYHFVQLQPSIIIHHHQVPDLEQTLAAMPLQTSLSSDNFKKFKPLLCPPVVELQRLSRNVILCLPYRVCLLLFQLKIRIPSLYVYTRVLKIPFASS